MASRQTGTSSGSKVIPMEMLEEQVWLSAAQNILSQNGGNPMHYTDIKRHILERNLVSVSGLKSTLESALCRDTQQPNSTFTVLPGRPGYFALRADSKASPQHPRSSPSPAHTPKVIKLTPGALRGRGAVTKVKKTKVPATQMKSLLGKVQGSKVATTSLSANGTANSKFERKYRRLKKIVKDLIFLNAAVCDEAIRTEEKVAIAKEERRYLLQRLLQQQALSELLGGKQSATPSSVSSQSIAHILGEIDSKKAKKSSAASATSKTKTARQILEESKPTTSASAGKGKKATKGSNKRLVQPIPLDNSGRPVFPIELGHLTVYCLGEVTPDRPGFHTAEHIFPVGFYSTRVYQSLDPRHDTCLYNCKIIDEGGSGPKFEICAETDERHTFTGFTASECHNKLLQTIKHIRCEDVVQLGDKGADFFGFSHPTIQNLIQSLAGARKCSRYKWMKFEVNREGLFYVEEDPAVNYDALCKIRTEGSTTPQLAAQTPSKSLHNLLTA